MTKPKRKLFHEGNLRRKFIGWKFTPLDQDARSAYAEIEAFIQSEIERNLKGFAEKVNHSTDGILPRGQRQIGWDDCADKVSDTIAAALRDLGIEP